MSDEGKNTLNPETLSVVGCNPLLTLKLRSENQKQIIKNRTAKVQSGEQRTSNEGKNTLKPGNLSEVVGCNPSLTLKLRTENQEQSIKKRTAKEQKVDEGTSKIKRENTLYVLKI